MLLNRYKVFCFICCFGSLFADYSAYAMEGNNLSLTEKEPTHGLTLAEFLTEARA